MRGRRGGFAIHAHLALPAAAARSRQALWPALPIRCGFRSPPRPAAAGIPDPLAQRGLCWGEAPWMLAAASQSSAAAPGNHLTTVSLGRTAWGAGGATDWSLGASVYPEQAQPGQQQDSSVAATLQMCLSPALEGKMGVQCLWSSRSLASLQGLPMNDKNGGVWHGDPWSPNIHHVLPAWRGPWAWCSIWERLSVPTP